MTHTTTRRRVLAAGATATVGAAALSGRAAAQSDLKEWLSNVDGGDEVVDRTGQDRVEVLVGAAGNGGAFAFAPVVVRVDPGTTVTWRWTGEGGSHNVVARDGTFESKLKDSEGATFTYVPSERGVIPYACTPHETAGMKGALVVGDVDVSLGGRNQTTTPTPTEDPRNGGSRTETPAPGSQRFDGWLAGTDDVEEVVDRTGKETVRITVGAEGNGGRRAFDPPAVRVSPGTTVVWEWMVDGTTHHVREESGAFDSGGVDEVGHQFGVTFSGERVWRYECAEHGDEGMRGVVVVGQPSQRETSGAAVLGGLGLIGILFAVARTVADRRDRGGRSGGDDDGASGPKEEPGGDRTPPGPSPG